MRQQQHSPARRVQCVRPSLRPGQIDKKLLSTSFPIPFVFTCNPLPPSSTSGMRPQAVFSYTASSGQTTMDPLHLNSIRTNHILLAAGACPGTRFLGTNTFPPSGTLRTNWE